MKWLDSLLEKLATFQKKYTVVLALVFLAITLFMLVGVPQIRMESDMSKSMPQDLPIYQLNDKVTDTFGGQDIILVIIKLTDESNTKDLPKDIRDKRVIHYVQELSASLSAESSVDEVTSVADYISNPAATQEDIDEVLSTYPELSQFFSKEYQSTFLLVRTNVGSSESKVKAMTALIQEKLDSFSKPPGSEIMITGTPPMQITLLEILGMDAIKTLSIAFVLIFIMLIIIEKSLFGAILISVPLSAGLIWTVGTMGWIGLEITVATAGLGAMILGLGVEYGVFMVKRYFEEREKNKSQLDSLKVSLPAVGAAILGSGLTTTVGFLALTLSIIPMMQKLGLSLALGIFYCLFSAVFVSPVIILLFEKGEYHIDDFIFKMAKKREDKHHDLD